MISVVLSEFSFLSFSSHVQIKNNTVKALTVFDLNDIMGIEEVEFVMSKISTKQLFDEYYADWDEVKAKKVRPQVDRPEVYAYEKKIGKQLIDMDVDELFDMLLTFRNNSSNKPGYVINYNSFNQISSEYRSIFNYYIDHYEVIKNPWYDKRMRGVQATERLAQNKAAYTYANVEEAIENVRTEYEEPRANYIEAFILLFYCGFSKAEEIVRLKESDIDFKNKLVRLSGRTVRLSDRCAELLQYVHSMDFIEGAHGDYALVSWNGGYFKFIIRPSQASVFNDRSVIDVGNFLNRMLVEKVKNKFELEISPRMLYLLGFYDSLVARFGKERAQQMIISVRNREDANDLLNHASYYGLNADNVSHLKRMLRPFLDRDSNEND